MSHDGQDLAEVTAEDDHLATKDVVTARGVAECPLDALDHFAISHPRLVEDDEDGLSDEVCLSRVPPDVARARLINGDWHFEGTVGCPRDIELLSSNFGGGD